MRQLSFLLIALCLFACNNNPGHRVKAAQLLDSTLIVDNLRFLSSDSCEGRKPGSAGHDFALKRIYDVYQDAGLDSLGASLVQNFTGVNWGGTTQGSNVIGFIKGKLFPEKFIVVSAHFDHLGFTEDKKRIFYGADDNASGTSCLMGLINYFSVTPHNYSLIFAAFDREESGLEGSSSFLKAASDTGLNIVFNLNIDMISRNKNREVYVCGLSHHPQLKYLVDQVKNKTSSYVLTGHDTGPLPQNWTSLSDHYPFHKAGIPFLYIGVEDHEDYHTPGDTFEKIDLNFLIENCNLIRMMLQAFQ